jgi:hypothetical protein
MVNGGRGSRLMVDKNVDKVDKAAERLAGAILGSYETALEGGAAVQETNLRLAQGILERNIEVLEVQAEINRQTLQSTLQSVAEQARKNQELFKELSRESFAAYDGFLDSLFSYYREAAPGHEEGRS